MWTSANWIKLKSLKVISMWQDAGYIRLALALVFSLLLHLFLIGKFGFSLPDLNEGSHVIEARLVLPKPIKAKSLTETRSMIKQSVWSEPPRPHDTLAEDVSIPHQIPTPVTVIQSEELQQSSDPVATNPESEASDNQIEDSGVFVNPNAYKYVETEFDIRTDIQAKVDSYSVGKAKIVYELLSNGERYQLRSIMQAKGILALFMPDLLQTSEGYLGRAGLQPLHYLYQFGDKKNKTYRADFDWESKLIVLHSAHGEQTLALTKATHTQSTQDLLSFMYQFMYVPPLQSMQLSITNGKQLGIYDYSFEGEETIPTKIGDLSTIHLLYKGDEDEEQTELWLALDYQYVPVKIRKTEKGGKVYDLLVTSLKTVKPVSPPQ
jgi:hypothetical protein